MNTSTKGRVKEKLCADELTSQGWVVEFRSQRLRFGRIDYGYQPSKQEREAIKAGARLKSWKAAKFDVVASKPGGSRILVSCKNFGANTTSGMGQERDNLQDYRAHFQPANTRIELWIWHAPRWRGRGKTKHFEQAHWVKEVIE